MNDIMHIRKGHSYQQCQNTYECYLELNANINVLDK